MMTKHELRTGRKVVPVNEVEAHEIETLAAELQRSEADSYRQAVKVYLAVIASEDPVAVKGGQNG